jgi:RimJ/RimL family protein N-acetyltransferase
LALRPATSGDARLLWSWANDPAVRASAFVPDVIPWTSHVAWLNAKLSSGHTRIWILERDGHPVGQVRYDLCGDVAEIDFSVAAEARGSGLGADLLRLSVPAACQELRAARLAGLVKTDNVRSGRAFEHAGFALAGEEVRNGATCQRYERPCTAEGR